MTRRDTLQCVHEPFGDAFYFGPERLHERYEDDEEARKASGYADSTYKSIFDRIEKDGSEVCSRLFFLSYYVLVSRFSSLPSYVVVLRLLSNQASFLPFAFIRPHFKLVPPRFHVDNSWLICVRYARCNSQTEDED